MIGCHLAETSRNVMIGCLIDLGCRLKRAAAWLQSCLPSSSGVHEYYGVLRTMCNGAELKYGSHCARRVHTRIREQQYLAKVRCCSRACVGCLCFLYLASLYAPTPLDGLSS